MKRWNTAPFAFTVIMFGIFFFSFRSVAPVFAQTQLARLTFEDQKQNELNIVDAVLQVVRNVNTNVTKNTKLEQTVKNDLLRALNAIEVSLTVYRDRVSDVKTEEELRAVNTEILQYILTHKNDIANSIRDTIQKVAENVAVRAEEFQKKVDQVLATLKVICPNETTTITAVENDSAALRTEIAALRQSITQRNASDLKTHLTTIGTLTQRIADNIERIQQACLPSS